MLNSFSPSKQLFRIEWLSETRFILPHCVIGHLSQEIRRSGKQIVPSPFGLEFREDPRPDSVLLCFGQLSQFGQRPLEYLTHAWILTALAGGRFPRRDRRVSASLAASQLESERSYFPATRRRGCAIR